MMHRADINAHAKQPKIENVLAFVNTINQYKMRGEYSKSIEDAVRRYPALKQTVNLAKEFGVTLLKHYAKFTNKGAVCQH